MNDNKVDLTFNLGALEQRAKAPKDQKGYNRRDNDDDTHLKVFTSPSFINIY